MVPHLLELKYGLTYQELLDAIDRRFRLKVALEGAVAEVHFERKLRIAAQEGWLKEFESHDVDGMHDFTFLTLRGASIRVEVKTVRNEKKPKVEIQKTRAAKGDASSRFYDRTHFDVIAVCMGRHTGDWSEFRYALVSQLPAHKEHPLKLQVMHPVLDDSTHPVTWFAQLQGLINEYEANTSL
jgi:hypothetical protein